MTNTAQADAEQAQVAPVRLADGQGQGVRTLGKHDQVDLIRHEALAEDPETEMRGIAGKQVHADGSILF